MTGTAHSLTILHVTWSLQTGGLEMVVLDLARLGPEFGLRPLVACLEKAGDLVPRLEAAGTPYYKLDKRPGIDPGAVRRLARLVREQRVDVLHAHNQGAMFYCGLAGLLTRRPVVYTRHGASFGKDASHRWMSRLVSRMARLVVCVGRDALRVTRERDKVPAAKARLIYNGADLELFDGAADSRAAVRAELGLAEDDQVIITVGRLSGLKDQAGLIAAVAALDAARLVLVGDGEERQALEATARRLGVSHRVIFTGVRRDVPRLLGAADVFALSSLSEGISIAILEAMAAGLPVVATRVGGNPEIVIDGQTGLLVEPGRPDLLAAALEQLLKDPRRAAALGAAGRRRAEEKFSLRAMVGAYAAMYREVALWRTT